jgi:hypothetical protein
MGDGNRGARGLIVLSMNEEAIVARVVGYNDAL